MERKISGISEFPEKKDNLEGLTKIFENIFRKFSVPFDFEPEFSEILVEWNAPNVSFYKSIWPIFMRWRWILLSIFYNTGFDKTLTPYKTIIKKAQNYQWDPVQV